MAQHRDHSLSAVMRLLFLCDDGSFLWPIAFLVSRMYNEDEPACPGTNRFVRAFVCRAIIKNVGRCAPTALGHLGEGGRREAQHAAEQTGRSVGHAVDTFFAIHSAALRQHGQQHYLCTPYSIQCVVFFCFVCVVSW